MFQRLKSVWIPGAYHGEGKRGVFFEGWYLKLIGPHRRERWAVIPGIFKHPDPGRAHAFIQVLDGSSGKVTYHRFPSGEFNASSTKFDLRVGESHFHGKGCRLGLQDQGQRIEGEVGFGELSPWPVRLLSPGVMGRYRFAPFMQTYHGVLSLDHALEGELKINGRSVNFQGGRGYLEKDWGRTFPRAYIWTQSNHFGTPGTSLTASAATIPWLGSWFRGFLVGLKHEGFLYKFTTYLGSTTEDLIVDEDQVTWTLKGGPGSGPEGGSGGYGLALRVERSGGGLLSSPELEGMTPRILESLTARIHVRLTAGSGGAEAVLFEGIGECAGLEVAGEVEKIAEIA